MVGEVIIISGPSAAGKTAIADMLARRSLSASMHLRLDQFYDSITKGYIPPYLPEADSQNRRFMSIALDAALSVAQSGYEVFLDGVILPRQIRPIIDYKIQVGTGQGVQRPRIRFFVLRPNLAELLRRSETRLVGLRDAASIGALHREFADLGEFDRYAVDTSERTPEWTAGFLWDCINKLLYEFDEKLSTAPARRIAGE